MIVSVPVVITLANAKTISCNWTGALTDIGTGPLPLVTFSAAERCGITAIRIDGSEQPVDQNRYVASGQPGQRIVIPFTTPAVDALIAELTKPADPPA